MKTSAPKRRARSYLDRNIVLIGNVWYFRRSQSGQIESFSLETSDKSVARSKRDAHLHANAGKTVADIKAARAGVTEDPTVGNLLDAYKQYHRPSEPTRKANSLCLLNVVRRATGIDDNDKARAVPLRKLDHHTVEAFQATFVAGKSGKSKEWYDAAYNANSILNKARMCFAHAYAFKSISLPDIHLFREAKFLPQKKDLKFTPFTAEESTKLLEAVDELKRTNSALWLCYALMHRCGMRNSEVFAARRLWIERLADGTPVFNITERRRQPEDPTDWPHGMGEFTPKGHNRKVAIPPDLLSDIEAHAGKDFIVANGMTPTARLDYCRRRINDWLGTILPGREAYDLRKQFGSLIAHGQGITAARDALGHASQSTTETYYEARLESVRPLTLDLMNPTAQQKEESTDDKKRRLLDELQRLGFDLSLLVKS